MVRIKSVEPRSLAERAGIKENDLLLSVGNNPINDVLDYRFYLAEREVVLRIRSGESEKEYTIQKGEYEDIGLEFESALMDEKHSCKNGCIFCFIDQNPEGLRDTLYFKDDDSRLSFIHGNYITLTNMTDEDVGRIIKMRFSPINISIHTTNPELRVKMMKNKRSGEVLRYLSDFRDAGLSMCGQIVLCKGINDGEELKRSLSDLMEYYPSMSSVAIVPAGLTKFRDKLYPLTDFNKKEACEVIDLIDEFGKKCKKKYGTRLFYAADEFYLKAERPLPKTDYYEDYPQIENGVGMLRSLSDDVLSFISKSKKYYKRSKLCRKVSIATGVASYPFISALSAQLMKICKGLQINVYKITNNFFGESITVSGLLTGKDILEQLSDKQLYDELFIPENALRDDEDIFLCGMTLSELSDSLKIKITKSPSDGYCLCQRLLGEVVWTDD